MAKLSNEKINTTLIAISMLLSGFTLYWEHNTKNEVENGVQNEQISNLSVSVNMRFDNLDKRMDRLEDRWNIKHD